MLGADLVGFQRPVAAQNFMQIWPPARRRPPTRARRSRIRGARCASGAFPVSIDFAEIEAIAAQPETTRAASELREALGSPRRILLGVDRLDYTKGIDVRLQAFRELLAERRHDRGRDGAGPGRDAEPRARDHYRQLRERVERAVGRINGEFGRLGHPAIHYLHHNLPTRSCARSTRLPMSCS